MPTGGLGKPPGIDALLLQRFSKLVGERWGLYYPEDKQGDLIKALQFGCLQRHCGTASDYYNLLTSDNATGDELMGILTIGETYFFRNLPQFEDLQHHILPELIQHRQQTTRHLRIWSAGSATGEEPYSLAILLRELLPDIDGWKIELIATDVNRQFLERARRGIYRSWSFREEGQEELLRRYFTPLGDQSFQVNEEVRRMVNFQALNLVNDPYPLNSDLLVCRNVLIYFSSKTVEDIIDRFYDVLTPGGYLLLGHTESSPYVSQKFRTVVSHRTLSYRKAPSYHKISAQIAPSLPAGPRRQSPAAPGPENLNEILRARAATREKQRDPAPVSDGRPGLAEAEALYERRKYDEALQIVSRLVGETRPGARALTLYGKLLANRNRLEEARIHLERAQGLDPCDVDAKYFLSLIQREQGELKDAIETLKRTIYLNDRLALPQFDLGNALAELGDLKAAHRHWRSARQILDSQAEVSPLELLYGISKGRLLVELDRRLKS